MWNRKEVAVACVCVAGCGAFCLVFSLSGTGKAQCSRGTSAPGVGGHAAVALCAGLHTS